MAIFLLILGGFYGFISQLYSKNEFLSFKYGIYAAIIWLIDVLFTVIAMGLLGRVNSFVIIISIFLIVGLIIMVYLIYSLRVRTYEI